MISVIVTVCEETKPYFVRCATSVPPAAELVVVEDTEKRGPSWARNQGIERSHGEYLYFLDADDYLLPGALDVPIDADMVISNFEPFGHKGTEPVDAMEQAKLYLSNPTSHTLFAYAWGRLFRADIIRDNDIRFDESLYTFEDVKFNYDYLMCSDAVSYHPVVLYHHTLRDGLTQASDPERMFGFNAALDTIGKYTGEDTEYARKILTMLQLVRMSKYRRIDL